MTQTGQNSAVRTREEQVELLTKDIGSELVYGLTDRQCALRHIIEAEARGAEEQRRKDAEGQEPVGYALRPEMELRGAFNVWPSPMATRTTWNVPLYTHPANVAALEGRIAELEEERDRLRDALIACGNNAGGFLAPGVSTEFLIECVPEEVRLKISSLTREGGV